MRFASALLIGLFLFTAATFAQSKNVLAEGNPMLTQTMINRLTSLMQWSLNSDLNEEERSSLRSIIISYWKNSDEKSIKSIVNSLDFEQKLSTASEDQKRNMQPQVEQNLLEGFAKEPGEPLYKLLLAVYQRNHNESSKSDSSVVGSGSLSDLVGRWQVSHMNSMTTQSVYTGAIGDANGMIAEFDIKPDGRILYSYYLSQSQYGCRTKIKISKTGRALVNGSRVNFVYDSGTTTSEDSCNAKYNYTKDLGKTSEGFDFSIKMENGKKQFCFASDKLKDCAVKLN